MPSTRSAPTPQSQWVITRQGRCVTLRVFEDLILDEVRESLLVREDFPIGDLVRSQRPRDREGGLIPFSCRQEDGRSMVHLAEYPASIPRSDFDTLYSLHHVLAIHRQHILGSLQQGYAHVCVPAQCTDSVDMHYSFTHGRGHNANGRVHKTLQVLQQKDRENRSPCLWLENDFSEAELYGGISGFVDHFSQLELVVQRAGCEPVQLPLLELIRGDTRHERT